MEKKKKWFFGGLICLVILFVTALMSVRSEKLTWDMLPDYQGEEMDGYVYLTEDDDIVRVNWTICYDDQDVYPVLFNENEFNKRISQIVGEENNIDVNNEEFDTLVIDRYWNSKTSQSTYYSGTEEQFNELQNFLLDYEYQFALVDRETRKYAYKLKDKLNLKVLKPQQKTQE